jgi:hypothetical protein
VEATGRQDRVGRPVTAFVLLSGYSRAVKGRGGAQVGLTEAGYVTLGRDGTPIVWASSPAPRIVEASDELVKRRVTRRQTEASDGFQREVVDVALELLDRARFKT